MTVRLICLDFDGVLADMRHAHYSSLNDALSEVDPKYAITPEEHTSTYDGLSTRRKLAMLTATKGLPETEHNRVFERKQSLTIAAIKQHIKRDERLISLLTEMRNRGYKLYLASNAIHKTVYAGLMALGLWQLFDRVYSNKDATNQKPSPEIYLRAMIDAGVAPDETLIVEDSKHGRQAAYKSGAHVLGVDNPSDFTLERLEAALAAAQPQPVRWVGGGINVLIPMSGLGSRFAQAGYKLPKPLIDVAGKPMIQRVVENMPIDGRFIFVLQKSHYDGYYLGTLLNSIAPGCEIITVDGMTEGAACTTLLAKNLINNDDHLIIANSDQFVDWNAPDFMWSMISNEADGGILTFRDTNPKWSFAREENGWVVEVAEKKPISDLATVGIYYYRRGSDYVKYAEQMIAKNIRVNGEFYVAPIFSQFIEAGKKIKTYPCKQMVGLGTPADLEIALEHNTFNERCR